jgi:hypothetical protein
MSRKQRPSRRLATSRAARRRRQFLAPPERLPAPARSEAGEIEAPALLDYDDLGDPSLDWEAD